MHGVANSRLDTSNLLLPLHLVSELNLGRLSAPDVRFKLAVLSIVLDYFTLLDHWEIEKTIPARQN